MTTPNQARIIWVDYAKGIGIFLFCSGHTLRGLLPSHIMADGPAFRFVDSWIYSLHMPLFFLLSGLFAERRVGRSAGTFLRDTFAAIGYPYLVRSTTQTLVQAATGRNTNSRTNLSEIAGILVNPIIQL